MDAHLREMVKSINPEQYEAVTTAHKGSVLVLAGAGCGKTAVLTRRIAYLAGSGINADQIVALTFSRKAALEMAQRLSDLMSHTSDLPLVTTFHGFALRILTTAHGGRSNFSRIGFEGKLQLLSSAQRYKLLSIVSNAGQRKYLKLNLTDLEKIITKMEVFPQRVRRLVGDKEWDLIWSIASKFSEIKKKRGLWDYSDLINGVLQLFRRFPSIAAHYGGAFRSVLVDEFQDTSPVQVELLEFLLGESTSLFAVGDDDQAIYGFRGADIRPICEFEKRFEDSIVIKLETNYRSIPAILNCANKLWVNKPATYRKILRSGKTTHPLGCSRPAVIKFKDQKAASEWIVKKINEIEEKYKIPPTSMAVLFRVNSTLSFTQRVMKTMQPDTKRLPLFVTVHGSKGLEYPVVFLCDLEEGFFPHYRIEKRRKIGTWSDFFNQIMKSQQKQRSVADDILDEELRLFYVGLTRAQRFLFLLSCGRKEYFQRQIQLQPSRFLKYLK
ncbi:ATP-dependent helicase [Chitinispirillales bacterium ANBcel5]|uniref:ATP-dependent helicase n=1 Tax=Cellulosispirillum alkaliphilum TaxID=3039283 RepID=UPI002A57C8B2|nr:ATP-dependent helicase [Chitinispirillales bacterium ANBcel5]